MTQATSERVTLNATAQNLIRILIASYFIAVSVGLVPGTDITKVFGQLLPEPVARPVAVLFFFGLSYMVLIGLWLRGAALLLALTVFWSSYLTMLDLGLQEQLGSFWRDLALIGALMLTYAEPAPRSHRRRGLTRTKAKARKIHPQPLSEPRRVEEVSSQFRSARPQPTKISAPVIQLPQPGPKAIFRSTREDSLAAE